MKALGLIFAALLATASCKVSEFALGVSDDAGGDGDSGTGDDGGGPGTIDAAPTPDATPEPDSCLPAPELCDELDNDCDMEVDEDFNLDADPNNCGACGNQCTYDFAFGLCNAGDCEQGDCFPGYIDLNGDSADGCEYFCIPTNGGVEACDAVDNDCDGDIDEDFMVDDDVLNCGTCGNVCNLLHATPICVSGVCEIDFCEAGFVDIDPVVPGCELACIDTGAELCDGVDNDCNGTIDDGFDTSTDVDNCGSCGNQCSYPQATPICSGGTCSMGVCDPNFYDIDGLESTGCEYACIDTGAEICDLTDNNCDGSIDEGNPGGGVACGTDTGLCVFGTTDCVAGTLACNGGTDPAPEVCDDLDNDCDGVDDNGFDKLNDPRYCGGCSPCMLDHAVEGCALGACTVAACEAGWIDFDGLASNGCEFECTPTGAEVCDGIDNDCDKVIDDVTLPPSFCNTAGECTGATLICAGFDGLRCNYKELAAAGADIELEVDGETLLLEETLCDGADGDCDGGTDEPFGLKGTACGEDGSFGTIRKLGSCRGTGTLVCNVAQDGLDCNITAAGAAAVDEVCDNADNDCDGHTDELFDFGGFTGVREALVGPINIGGTDIVMYQYEASRPDANLVTPGIVDSRACSVFNRFPWQNLDYDDALAACTAAGMRLCVVTRDGGGNVLTDEWGRFCEGAADRVYPYGNTYQALTCNGSDYDPISFPIGINDDVATRTGALASCQSLDGSNDQSGNLKEWVTDPRDVSGTTVHTLRGGSFDNHSGGLTCDFDFTVATPDFRFPNVGFRCCSRDCAAGTADCGGSCRNLATSFTNCGACGSACAGGETCQNGFCCPTGTEICADQCVPTGTCP